MGPGLEYSGNRILYHRKEGNTSKPPRNMEDTPHRSKYSVDRALAHHTLEQRIDSIRIFIPVKNRYEPLINMYNDDDCSDCNEYEIDDYILYYNNERYIKGVINNSNCRERSEETL